MVQTRQELWSEKQESNRVKNSWIYSELSCFFVKNVDRQELCTTWFLHISADSSLIMLLSCICLPSHAYSCIFLHHSCPNLASRNKFLHFLVNFFPILPYSCIFLHILLILAYSCIKRLEQFAWVDKQFLNIIRTVYCMDKTFFDLWRSFNCLIKRPVLLQLRINL